jgi:hypothetical protein
MADMYLTRRAEEARESALESETLADDLAPGGAQFPTDGEPRARSGRQLQTVSCMHARKGSCKLSARGAEAEEFVPQDMRVIRAAATGARAIARWCVGRRGALHGTEPNLLKVKLLCALQARRPAARRTRPGARTPRWSGARRRQPPAGRPMR